MAKKKAPDKLAQDAAAALAAGMSYGKWKAMQDPVKIEKPKLDEVPEGWRKCKRCGEPFKPNKYGRNQIYCDIVCQKSDYREKKRIYMAKRRAEGKA